MALRAWRMRGDAVAAALVLVGCSSWVDTEGVRPLDVDAAADAFVRGCPQGYFGAGNDELCFRFVDEALVPADAQQACQQDLWRELPAHLAVLDNPELRTEVTSALSVERASVGLYRSPSTMWHWVTGERLGDANGDPANNADIGDPNGLCAGVTAEGTLFPHDCSMEMAYVCGWDFRSSLGAIPAP